MIDKGYTWKEIESFWNGIFHIADRVKEGKAQWKDAKVCTGCGMLNIERLSPPALSCCPDANYKLIFPQK